jgi:ADP-ribosylglycohydrolase
MIGQDKDQLWKALLSFKFTHPALVQQFSAYKIVEDLTSKSDSAMTSSGWVVHTLDAALWGFFKYDSWEEGALAVVNLGEDSDTVGAVYGALAGVFYGYEAIPERWILGMKNAELIQDISRRFAALVSPQPDRG